MQKNKQDSWIDISNSEKNFLGRKRVDLSTFKYGTTIPERYHEAFKSCLSKEVEKGPGVKVKLLINNMEFKATIRWPNSKGRKGITLQLLYSSKKLKELLQNELEVSYDYIINYLKENDKKPSSIPEKYQEYIDFYKGEEADTFVLNLVPKSKDKSEDEELDEDVFEDDTGSEFDTIGSISEEVTYIHNYIKSKGFYYSKKLINNFYLSLKTKPFVILSGISGTGKSKLVELFAEAVGANYENKRFKLISVRPDWSDATDLLGYRNIENKFTPGIITETAFEAVQNPDSPYFICLDEMNLARVEYYFSDILSLMETRRINDEGEIITQNLLGKEQFGRDERAFNKYGDIYIPQNLYIIGTVNMDETTFPFSKKVLDRANTIEFNEVDLNYNFEEAEIEQAVPKKYHNDFFKSDYLKISHCKEEKETAGKVIDKLIEINDILKKYQQHFAYRVRDEIVFYVIYAVKNDLFEFDQAMDYSIVQKILPKIGGSGAEVLDILVELFNKLNGSNHKNNGYIDEKEIKVMENQGEEGQYRLTSRKIIYMIRRFTRDGFTTFWQ